MSKDMGYRNNHSNSHRHAQTQASTPAVMRCNRGKLFRHGEKTWATVGLPIDQPTTTFSIPPSLSHQPLPRSLISPSSPPRSTTTIAQGLEPLYGQTLRAMSEETRQGYIQDGWNCEGKEISNGASGTQSNAKDPLTCHPRGSAPLRRFIILYGLPSNAETTRIHKLHGLITKHRLVPVVQERRPACLPSSRWNIRMGRPCLLATTLPLRCTPPPMHPDIRLELRLTPVPLPAWSSERPGDIHRQLGP